MRYIQTIIKRYLLRVLNPQFLKYNKRVSYTRGTATMYSSVQAAWAVLREAKIQDKPLSNLQLQKLVYICHGYLLGWKNVPLIEDKIEAWKYGPVIAEVYKEFNNEDKEIEVSGAENIITDLDKDENAKACIRQVVKIYGDYNGNQLVNLTHQEDSPWFEAFNKKRGFSSIKRKYIQNDKIRSHFLKVIHSPNSVRGL